MVKNINYMAENKTQKKYIQKSWETETNLLVGARYVKTYVGQHGRIVANLMRS